MEGKHFKKLFSTVAKQFGFTAAFGAWFTKSPESLIVLELQKSNYSNLYYLNIHVYVDGISGKVYTPSKDLLKTGSGHIFRREAPEYQDVFDLENELDEFTREERLRACFATFLIPFIERARTRDGIRGIIEEGRVVSCR